MADIATITAALAGIKNALDIAKAIKSADVSLERAEIKLRMADLIESLADAKVELADLQAIVKRCSELETDVVSLRNDKTALATENANLKRRLGELLPAESPDPDKTLLLALIAEYGSASVGVLSTVLNEVRPGRSSHPEVIQLQLSELSKQGYVRGDQTNEYMEQCYRLCDKARRLLDDNGFFSRTAIENLNFVESQNASRS